ncbi:tol-pal system protein YbgF [Thermodesulfobacteriota bacterium]
MKISKKHVVGAALVFLTMCWTAGAGASLKRVAVLELINKAEMSDDEAYYLTDLVRNAASRVLRQWFLVITRESLFELLPPGRDPADCTSAECEVELGRLIGVDYIVTGEILHFFGELRANLKAHHSETGEFLGARTAKADTPKDLENSINDTAMELCGLVRSHAGFGSHLPSPVVSEGEIGETPASDWQIEKTGVVIVRLESDPTGAVVMADGRLLCQSTPCSKALRHGPVTISMQKERYHPKEEMIEINKGTGTVSWKLSPNFGMLSVNSEPMGLAVKINGKDEGKTPIHNKELNPGAYEVLVSDPRYYDKGERINIKAGDTKEITATLQPRVGGLMVSAKDGADNDLTGEVYVNGRRMGKCLQNIEVIIGEHSVEVRTGQGNWTGRVNVAEHRVEEVVVQVESLEWWQWRYAEAPSEEGNPYVRAEYDAAYEFYKVGDYRACRDAFIVFIGKFPNTPLTDNGLYWLGQAYYKLKDYKRAAVAYDTVMANFPASEKLPDALLKQGFCFDEIGEKSAAMEVLTRAIEEYPDSKQAEYARIRLDKMN